MILNGRSSRLPQSLPGGRGMLSRKSMDLGDRQTWFWTLMPTLETLEPQLPPQENGDDTPQPS